MELPAILKLRGMVMTLVDPRGVNCTSIVCTPGCNPENVSPDLPLYVRLEMTLSCIFT